MRNIFCCFFNQFLILLLPSFLNRFVWAIDPEQLKPCFERYDGHKLFGAVPIHSEWRMKKEEECLPFCIKASSRCSSIVYDKYEHTCYYFSVNGIEIESIERNSRMVYLQVAERRCVDEMLMVMESEDSPVQHQIQSQMENTGNVQQHFTPLNSRLQSADFGKINYGKVEAQMMVPTDSKTSSQFSTTFASSSSTQKSSEPSLSPIFPSSTLPSLMSTVTDFVKIDDQNKGKEEYSASLALYETTVNPPTSTEVLTTTVVHEDFSLLPLVESGFENSQKSPTVSNLDNLSQEIPKSPEQNQPSPNFFSSNATGQNENEPDNLLMKSMGMNSAVNSIPSFLPVISRFKAVQRRPVATFSSSEKIEEEEKVDFRLSNDIRRHPQNRSVAKPKNAIPTTVLPIALTSMTTELPLYETENNFNQDSQPETKNVAYAYGREVEKRVSVPRVEHLPPLSSDEVEYEDKVSSNVQEIESGGCRNSEMNEIWLAVESAKLKNSLTNRKDTAYSLSYSATPKTPKDCINACKTRRIARRRRLCDSFTFFETTKQCVFDSTDKYLMEKIIQPEQRGDFTTRVFRRLCFPSNMTPFKSCAEFLAFRTYALAIPAREFFNGLPTGVDGISACIELCVLSSDFQCRSAIFDAAEGVCQLFDEHSLSSPLSFKEHSRSNQLYFENGCLDGGEVPQEPTLTSNVQRVQSSQEIPRRIDFNKILQKH